MEGSGLEEISLALVTYNQSDLLKQFLENYLRFGYQVVKLTIVDDGSDDATPEILASHAANKRIHLHRLPHGSISKARNHALRNSPTPWLAFSDTDCQLDHCYFETLRSIPDKFAASKAVEGAIFPPPGPKPPFTHSLANPTGGTFATANMAFHVSSVLGLGGFDEAFQNFREDTDLALTIFEHSGPIPFCPDLVVVHPHLPRSFGKSLSRAFTSQAQIIRSEVRLFEKHPKNYRLVRHSDNVRATLWRWCWKYSARYAKENLRYLVGTPELTTYQRFAGIRPACAAIVVAVWEQICVGILCMLQLDKIMRLKSK